MITERPTSLFGVKVCRAESYNKENTCGSGCSIFMDTWPSAARKYASPTKTGDDVLVNHIGKNPYYYNTYYCCNCSVIQCKNVAHSRIDELNRSS